MSIESERDLSALKRIGRIVGLILNELRAHVRPGVTTAELDQRCAELLAHYAARSAPRVEYGFPGNICISVNDEAVHGVPGARTVRAGDLVKLDLVAEKGGYVADAAITVAVPPVSPVQRQLVKCARRAFQRAADVIQAGRRIAEIGKAVESEVRRNGFAVIRQLTGHGVGRATHEEPPVPNFAAAWSTGTLTEGLVIAVEPIIAAGSGDIVDAPDGWTVMTADGSLAAHYEHTLVVTRDRPIILTAA